MIIVVIEAEVAVGLVGEALAQARAGLERAGRPTGGRQSRLFQGRDDPTRFLYLGLWESREAHESALGTRAVTGVEAALSGPIVPRYFRSLVSFERMMEPMEIVVCLMIDGQPSSASSIRDLLLEWSDWRERPAKGMVLAMSCEEIDAPGRFLVVSGWRTAEAFAVVSAEQGAAFRARLAEIGATYRVFLGNTRFDSLLSL